MMKYELLNELNFDLEGEEFMKQYNEMMDQFIGKKYVARIDGQSIRYELVDNIPELLESLAIKDGLELVRFENGSLGFIAYYTNHSEYLELVELTNEQYEVLEWEESQEDMKKFF